MRRGMAGDCAARSACSGERQRRGVYLISFVRTVASSPEGWKSALSYCPRTTGSRDIVATARVRDFTVKRVRRFHISRHSEIHRER
eukprot:3281798-Prymnesium_polylepis.1